LGERVKAASKAAGAQVRDSAVSAAKAIAAGAVNANDLVVVDAVPAGDNRDALLAALKTVRDTCPRCPVMLMSIDTATGKVAVACAVPDAGIAKGLKAGDWLRDACAVMGGKGGGKPDNAMGGGSDPSKVPEAIRAARAAALRIIM
jgi:alanyl-tRNA synthetase